MIRAIAAIDDKRGIGLRGSTPWHIPAELAYFRECTSGATVLMGPRVYELFKSPLADRRNVVASHKLESVREGFELIHDVAAFLQTANEDVWVIGGASLYESLLVYCDELYLTHIAGNYDCDRFFPEYTSDFTLARQSEEQSQNGYQFRFAVYAKNR